MFTADVFVIAPKGNGPFHKRMDTHSGAFIPWDTTQNEGLLPNTIHMKLKTRLGPPRNQTQEYILDDAVCVEVSNRKTSSVVITTRLLAG